MSWPRPASPSGPRRAPPSSTGGPRAAARPCYLGHIGSEYFQPEKAKEVDTSSKISMFGLAASKTAMENGLGLTVNYWKFNTYLKSLFILLFLKIY